MIEAVIRNYLNDRMSVPVTMELPADKPEEYVVIEKTGSSMSNHLCSSMFAIQSYSSSMYKAALLNEQVKEAMAEAVELNEITSVRLNSDYNYTEPGTTQYRYQAVFDITHY